MNIKTIQEISDQALQYGDGGIPFIAGCMQGTFDNLHYAYIKGDAKAIRENIEYGRKLGRALSILTGLVNPITDI